MRERRKYVLKRSCGDDGVLQYVRNVKTQSEAAAAFGHLVEHVQLCRAMSAVPALNGGNLTVID